MKKENRFQENIKKKKKMFGNMLNLQKMLKLHWKMEKTLDFIT